MTGFVFYFVILFFACSMINFVQLPVTNFVLTKKQSFSKNKLFLFLFLVSPIILCYTFRYSIGTDYFAYKDIFEKLQDSTLNEYLILHNKNVGSFYVEPAYFILNRYLSFSYGSLLCLISIIIFTNIYYGAISVYSKIDLGFVVFIYFCTQFIYSMNGVRFALSITFIFLGLQYIINKQIVGWIICVLFATGFHKTSIICAQLFLCAIVIT